MKKPKLSVSKTIKSVQLGASAPKKPPNPLVERKDYKKDKQEPVNVSFGQTGLTGES